MKGNQIKIINKQMNGWTDRHEGREEGKEEGREKEKEEEGRGREMGMGLGTLVTFYFTG